jgi:hypothetical protein
MALDTMSVQSLYLEFHGRAARNRDSMMRTRWSLGIIPLLVSLAGCSIAGEASINIPTVTPASPDEHVWAQLERRPVTVPRLAAGSPCPITPYQAVPPPPNTGPDSLDFTGRGEGPVYLEVGGVSGTLRYAPPSFWHSSEWGGNANFAEHAPINTYVLIRGHQLDGPYQLRIGEGDFPPLEVRLDPTPWAEPTGWTSLGVYPRVRAPGCYAFQIDGLNQVDGTSFSYLIVFQAQLAT